MTTTMIPSTRPVRGEDLAALRDQLGVSVGEACWLYGLSMAKWMLLAKERAKEPLRRPSLALLVRALNWRPDLNLLPPQPSAHDIYARLRQADPSIDKKRFSVFFGSEASSGYRWITLNSEISPALARLFLVFQRLYDKAMADGLEHAVEFVSEWRQMVELEATQRGIAGIFNHGRWKSSAVDVSGPIRGEDLDSLREALGLSTMDACWLYGLSMTKWTDIARNDGAKKPLTNVTLALLVRVLRKYPDVSPLTPPPDPSDVFATIAQYQPIIDRKRMAIMFGCEASSGYRWLSTGSKLGPSVSRLLKVFMSLAQEVDGDLMRGTEMIRQWDEMVESEALARGATSIFSTGRWVHVEGKLEDS